MDRETTNDQTETRMRPLSAFNDTDGVRIHRDGNETSKPHYRDINENNPATSSMHQSSLPCMDPLMMSRKEAGNGNSRSSRTSDPFADLLSSSLANFAREAGSPSAVPRLQNKVEGEGASSSSGEPVPITRREGSSNGSSDRDSSTANGSSANNSANSVTAIQTNSSGDDRDSSSGNASGGMGGGVTFWLEPEALSQR
jgi:hypothetical protein